MYQDSEHNEDTDLGKLALAFFAPIYFYSGKLTVGSAVLMEYAGIYMKRNLVAALLSFAIGEFLYTKEYAVLGTLMSGLFILFSGLCSIFLVAIFEKNRNTRVNRS